MKDNSNVKAKVQEPPQLAVRMANYLFLFGFILSALTSFYIIHRIFNPLFDDYDYNFRHYIYLSITGFSIIIFGFGIKLNNRLKVNLSIFLVTMGFSLYSIELILRLTLNNDLKNADVEAHEKKGVKWDNRYRNEYINYLKNFTKDDFIFPHFNSGGLIFTNYLQNLIDDEELQQIIVEANGLHPLSNISNSTIVHCNEHGTWQSFKTDKYGFSNPIKIIQNKNSKNITLLGDSFVEAHCVPQGEDIGYQLRDLGYNINNLGKAGGGVIHYNAIYREFGKRNSDFIPDYVIMFLYYLNDLNDTYQEYFNPIYQKYINNENYNQDLIGKQKESNKFKKKYFELLTNSKFREKYPELPSEPSLSKKKYLSFNQIFSFIKLGRLREPFIKLIYNQRTVNKVELFNGDPNGQVTFTFPNGDKFEGQLKDGKPNGQGALTRNDGSNYVGAWKRGVWDGHGTLISKDFRFVGQWKGGRPYNVTKYYKNHGIKGKFINGEWKDQEIIFKQIEMISNEISKDAKFLIVYLPSFAEVKDKNYKYSNLVKSKLNQLNINYIDLNSTFKEYELNQIFYYGLPGHYSADGYGIVAKEIEEKIKADVIIPTNSK